MLARRRRRAQPEAVAVVEGDDLFIDWDDELDPTPAPLRQLAPPTPPPPLLERPIG
jgi:hypothetical protein